MHSIYDKPAYAALILRYSLAFVLLWFSFSQFLSPESWFGFLPAWTEHFFISQHMFVQLNALFELLAAAFLLLGMWVRFFSVLLALHMLSIAYTVGFDGIGLRDIGLAGGFLALAVLGDGAWALGE